MGEEVEGMRCWLVGRKVVLVCFVVWVESLGGGVLVKSSIEQWRRRTTVCSRVGLTIRWLFVEMMFVRRGGFKFFRSREGETSTCTCSWTRS
jgi:hypothetical protein